jgi:hypothetical protein
MVERLQRNNGLIMITFDSLQSDCARHVRKNEFSITVNFASQIALSICTVVFAKRVKTNATIFKSWCSRLSLICHPIHGPALPFSFVRFLRLANGPSKNRRSPATWSRNGRAATCETTRKLARNGHAMSSSQSAQRTMQHFAKPLAR